MAITHLWPIGRLACALATPLTSSPECLLWRVNSSSLANQRCRALMTTALVTDLSSPHGPRSSLDALSLANAETSLRNDWHHIKMVYPVRLPTLFARGSVAPVFIGQPDDSRISDCRLSWDYANFLPSLLAFVVDRQCMASVTDWGTGKWSSLDMHYSWGDKMVNPALMMVQLKIVEVIWIVYIAVANQICIR